MHGWVGTCMCAWAGRGESRTEQQKRGQEPGSGSQNPGTVLGVWHPCGRKYLTQNWVLAGGCPVVWRITPS